MTDTTCREGHRLRFTTPVAYAGPCCCGPATDGEEPDCRPCCPTDGDRSGALSARVCPTREPEPHLSGEFPMTCYRCHIEADS